MKTRIQYDSRLPERFVKTTMRGMRSDISGATAQTYRTLPSTVTSHNYVNVEWYQSSLVGTTNPGWRDQIRSGFDATTNAVGLDFTWQNRFLYAKHGIHIAPNLAAFFEQQTSDDEIYGYPYISPPQSQLADPSIQADVEDRTRRKIVEQIQSIQSSVELGQDIGELKQTIEGVIHPLNTLKEYVLGFGHKLKKIKRLKNQSRHSLRNALTDTYLEFNFGWKPLARDIADAVVGLQNQSHADRYPVQASSQTIFAGASNTQDFAASASVGSSPNLIASAPTKTTSSYQVRYKGMVRSFAVNGRFTGAQVLQLDLPHFIPTAWDLIPYSFVVDYFANVGDIISAWSLRDGTVIYLDRTERYVHRRETNVVLSGADAGGIYLDNGDFQFSGHHAWVERVQWNRSKISQGALIPPFRFTVPVSKKPWINIAALISANFKSLVPFYK